MCLFLKSLACTKQNVWGTPPLLDVSTLSDHLINVLRNVVWKRKPIFFRLFSDFFSSTGIEDISIDIFDFLHYPWPHIFVCFLVFDILVYFLLFDLIFFVFFLFFNSRWKRTLFCDLFFRFPLPQNWSIFDYLHTSFKKSRQVSGPNLNCGHLMPQTTHHSKEKKSSWEFSKKYFKIFRKFL